jgi:hypothetical protein
MAKESDRKEINRLLRRMVASPFRALLGRGDGTVSVAGKTGYVWARRLGQEEKVFQAYNRSISSLDEGKVVLVQESRVEGLAGYEIVGSAGGDLATSSGVLETTVADKDSDGDMDPYVSTLWSPRTLSNGDTGTINWIVDFGLPEKPRAIHLQVAVRDAGSAGGLYYILLQAKASTTIPSLFGLSEAAVNDRIRHTYGLVSVADDGTTYYSISASGVGTMDVWIRVVAWI